MAETPDIVERVRQIVWQKMRAKCEEIRFNAHIIFVVEYARQLAVLLNADQEITVLGALFHDITKPDDQENHHLSGAQEAGIILSKIRYSQEKIDQVKHCIEAHRRTREPRPQTLEAVCVSNADKIAHIIFPFYSIYHRFTLEGQELLTVLKKTRRKINENWEALIPEARDIAQAHYTAVCEILENMILDLENKKAKS